MDSASTAPTSWRQRLAVQLYSFHDDLERDLPGTLRRIKALGFDRVETYPVAGVSASQLRAALDAADLVAVSAHMPWERIASDPGAVIADVRILGAEQFGPGSIGMFDGRPFRSMTTAEARQVGAALKRACAAARSANLRVFIHIHGNELAPVSGTAPLDHMLRAAEACFEIEADLAWVTWAGGDPAAFIRRYSNRVRSLHLKDLASAAVGQDMARLGPASFPPIGQGSIAWGAVMRAARLAGVTHYVIEDESRNPERQIPQSLGFLNSISN